LVLNLELSLTILVVGYLFLATVIAFIRCKKYLKGHPNETKSVSYYHNDERNTLTFAGFSLTALALLVGLQFNGEIPLSTTIQFFSLAFALMVLSFTFIRFRFVNAFIYLSDVFLNGGLLSIGCGFLVFFVESVSISDASTIIFTLLLIALVAASLVNYIFFDIYSRGWEDDKNDRGKKTRI
jgi:hypothetical protein